MWQQCNSKSWGIPVTRKTLMVGSIEFKPFVLQFLRKIRIKYILFLISLENSGSEFITKIIKIIMFKKSTIPLFSQNRLLQFS